jgi:cytochrome P450
MPMGRSTFSSSSQLRFRLASLVISWAYHGRDIPSFTRLVYKVSRFISFSFTPDEIPDIEAAARQLQDYVERTLDRRRRAPCGDFLSRFVAAADAAAEMSPIEIIFQIVQLIVGGTDTTRVAIVMQVALLLQQREPTGT